MMQETMEPKMSAEYVAKCNQLKGLKLGNIECIKWVLLFTGTPGPLPSRRTCERILASDPFGVSPASSHFRKLVSSNFI